MHHRYMIGARLMIGIADIDEQELERLVALFYARVRADEELGPIFNDAIDDWPEPLEKLVAFWSSVVLTSGRYKRSEEHTSALQSLMHIPYAFCCLQQQTDNETTQ